MIRLKAFKEENLAEFQKETEKTNNCIKFSEFNFQLGTVFIIAEV